jgi:ATP-dependent protease ClpP protease subunit
MRPDDFIARDKEQHRRAVAAGLLEPGPPLRIAIRGDITPPRVARRKGQLASRFHADLAITFDSKGGSGRAGLELGRAIRHRPGETRGHVCSGSRCDSAALDVFLCCDIRTAAGGAWFLLHKTGLTTASGVRWTADNLPAALAEIQELDERAMRLIARRTGARLQNLLAEAATERPMSATSAWQFGILTSPPIWL